MLAIYVADGASARAAAGRSHSAGTHAPMRLAFIGVLTAALCCVLALVTVQAATADTVITDHPYVRHDGGNDSAIALCNDNDPSTGQANIMANGPSVAIKPDEPTFIVAGANDYCNALVGAWQGLYTSRTGGTSWTDSLVPGYPEDTSAEGQASPTFRPEP